MQTRPLPQVIAELPDRFADAPRPRAIDACDCCRPESIAVLLQKPRAELTADELWSFAFRVLGTVGDAADLRYFAPRLLELALSDERTAIDVELVFGKLAQADWRDWPEAPVLRELADALWHDTLTRQPPRFEADTVLDALGRFDEPRVGAYLLEWSQLETTVAISQLLDLVQCRLHGRRVAPEIADWLDGPAREAVRTAFDQATTEETLTLLADLDEHLDWLSLSR